MRRLVPVLALLALTAPPAAAQSGSQPDPDSPAGVEYQLPLDRVREETRGEGGSPGRGGSAGGGEGGQAGAAGSDAPLFGAGIERAPGAGDGSGGSGGGDREDGGSGGNGGSGGAGGGSGESPFVPSDSNATKAATAATDGSSGVPATLVIVLGVLAMGAGAGLLLKRGLGRD